MSNTIARSLPRVKSLGVVFFRSGGDGGQGGATVGAAGVVGVEHVGQALQGGLGEVSAFAVLPLLVALAGRSRSGGVRSRCRGRPGATSARRLISRLRRSMGLLRPDLGPVLAGEGGERGQVRLGVLQGVDDVLVLGRHGLLTGLGEDRGDQGARGLGCGPSRARVVMLRAKRGPAALPGGSGKDRPDGGADAGVGVTGDQDHALGVVG